MDWMKDMFRDKTSNGKQGRTAKRTDVFEGTMETADKKVAEGLTALMDYALNAQGSKARGVRNVGDRVVFEMHNVMVGVNGDGTEPINAGNFEIVVRRVS